MRKIIVSEFMTLDGVVEAPGGEHGHPHSGWVFDHMGPEQEAYKLRETREAGALLLGRRTYEGFAAAWPQRGGEFADKMNAMPKHVVSSTLTDLEWQNSHLVEGGVADGVRALKQQAGDPILVAGSATLVQELTRLGLVDEYRLMIFPVIVGGGLRPFPEGREKVALSLSGTETFPSGVVVQTYVPAG